MRPTIRESSRSAACCVRRTQVAVEIRHAKMLESRRGSRQPTCLPPKRRPMRQEARINTRNRRNAVSASICVSSVPGVPSFRRSVIPIGLSHIILMRTTPKSRHCRMPRSVYLSAVASAVGPAPRKIVAWVRSGRGSYVQVSLYGGTPRRSAASWLVGVLMSSTFDVVR